MAKMAKIVLWAPYTIWQAVLKGLLILRQKAYFGPDYCGSPSPFQKGRGQERLKIKGCPAKKPPTSNIRTGRSNEKQQIDFPPPAIFLKETSLSEAFN